MTGMNAQTGKAIDGQAHIKQSLSDILTTPIGSRVMRRDYGSLLPELVDQPLSGANLLRAYAAVVVAIGQWEPRVRLSQIVNLVNTGSPGTATLEMDLSRVDQPNASTQRVSVALNTGGPA